MVSETKLDCSFPNALFIIEGQTLSFRYDIKIVIFVKEDIPANIRIKSLSKDRRILCRTKSS